MKALSNKAYGVLSAWAICTGILSSAFFGWLEFPSEKVALVYIVAWIACANAALTLALQSSRLALALLISGWLLALALCIPNIGVFPATYAFNFGLLLLSTFVGIEQRFVHIGLGIMSKKVSQRHKYAYKKNNWMRGRENNPRNCSSSKECSDIHGMPSYKNTNILRYSISGGTSYRNTMPSNSDTSGSDFFI